MFWFARFPPKEAPIMRTQKQITHCMTAVNEHKNAQHAMAHVVVNMHNMALTSDHNIAPK